MTRKKSKGADPVKPSEALAKDPREKTAFYDALPRSGTSTHSNAQRFRSRTSKSDECEVRLGRLQRGGRGRPTQRVVGVRPGVDLVQMSVKGDFDAEILTTGDGDFPHAVEKALEVSAKAKLAYFPGSPINEEFRRPFDGCGILHDALLGACEL